MVAVVFIAVSAGYAGVSSAGQDPGAGKSKAKAAENGAGGYKASCRNCPPIVAVPSGKTAMLYSADNGKNIELTLLKDEAKLLEAFNLLAARDDLPYRFMDGCYARAHKMAKILNALGIVAGKYFLEGEMFADTEFGEVGWRYQVAPVVLLAKGNSIIPYVIDPSFFSKPVLVDEWRQKLLSKSKAKISREYFTNRFAYTPDDRESDQTDYTKDSLDDMDYTNRNFSRLLWEYDNKK